MSKGLLKNGRNYQGVEKNFSDSEALQKLPEKKSPTNSAAQS